MGVQIPPGALARRGRSMTDGLSTLLAGILDYAGLFPPAALDLPSAVNLYAGYRRGPHAAILGRFVCPAGRLAELSVQAGHFAPAPFQVSALGRGGNTAEE